jgi:hypothetical protein
MHNIPLKSDSATGLLAHFSGWQRIIGVTAVKITETG